LPQAERQRSRPRAELPCNTRRSYLAEIDQSKAVWSEATFRPKKKGSEAVHALSCPTTGAETIGHDRQAQAIRSEATFRPKEKGSEAVHALSCLQHAQKLSR